MKKYLAIFAIAVVSFSCEDFLEETNPNQFAEDVIYQSIDDMRFSLNALYDGIEGFPQDGGGFNEKAETTFMAYTDDCWDRSTRGTSELDFTPNTSIVQQQYVRKWDFIRQCNEFISRAPLVTFDDVRSDDERADLEALRDRFVAEARFIRAFHYDRLNFIFGHVPLVLEPTDFDVYPFRVDRTVVFDWVSDELTKLASQLPWSYEGGLNYEKERITRGAVLGLLARHSLNGVGWYEDFISLYVTAKEAAQIVYDNGPYGLEQGIEGFEDLFSMSMDDALSVEVIWKSNYGQSNRSHNYARAILPKGAFSGLRANNSAYINATSSLIESFQDTLGLDITDEASIYDPVNPWDGRDPRLDATIVRAGEILEVIGGSGDYTFDANPDIDPEAGVDGYTEDGIPNDDVTQGGVHPSGYYFQKYMNFDFITSQEDQIDYMMMRFPEIILMYAEGLLGESGDIARAMSLVDEVRTRVGMPTVVESYGTVSSINDALNIILQERRFEFACEGPQRYFDIKRYRLGESVLAGDNAIAYGIPIGADVNEGELDDSFRNIIGTRVFNAATYYWWPLPESAINGNPNLALEPLDEIESFN